MIRPGEPAVVIRSHMLSSVEVSYPLGLWLPMTILVDICDARHIQPPDQLKIYDGGRVGTLRLLVSYAGYVCSVVVRDDTDTLYAPFFRSGCHALLDAYESRAQGEPPTVSIQFRAEREKS